MLRFCSRRSHRRALLTGLWVLAGLSLISGRSQAYPVFVNSGFDLFSSTSGTTFAGQDFVGVAAGNIDFGGTIGVRNVGNADTVVHRLGVASVPDPVPPSATAAPIPIEMVALQLVSVNPIDLGAGTGFYFVTLQSARGGPASVGQMTITFDTDTQGSFSSFFDVFFDVRIGALNGPIVLSDTLTLSSSGVPWTRTPPPLALEITGVNSFLDGVDRAQDFWPTTPFQEQHPSGAIHRVQTATSAAATPEPAALALVGIVAIACAIGVRRRGLTSSW